MLLNEVFALACRARYEQMGLVVDRHNGEFAHCPYPRGMGDSGYYLLHDDHQHQGLLQSRDLNKCCFFSGHAKRWLMNCKEFPEGYFELWEIYEEFAADNVRKNKASAAAKLVRQKKVELTRILDGEVFVFECGADACRTLNLNPVVLYRACTEKSLSVGGYLARYWTPDVVNWGEGLFHMVGEVIQKKENARKEGSAKGGETTKLARQKKIELTRILDDVVFTFDSRSEAARVLNLDRSHLRKVCQGKQKSIKGYTARYL